MIVMPSNNCKWQVHYWQGVYGGLGHLYSIGGFRGPYPHLPYALDNGRFPAWSSGKEWSEADYLKLLDKASGAARAPMWALVPDVVRRQANLPLAQHDLFRGRVGGRRLVVDVGGARPGPRPRALSPAHPPMSSSSCHRR